MADSQPAYLTVGSHSILACRDSLAAAYCTRYLGSVPLAASPASDYAIAVKPGPLPRGITMIATQPHDIRVAELDAAAVHDLHILPSIGHGPMAHGIYNSVLCPP